jgi:hypothetical protein
VGIKVGVERAAPEIVVRTQHFHLSTEIDVIITDAAELVLYSKREQRVLVAFTPAAAERVVLEVFEKWPDAKKLMEAKARKHLAKIEAEAAEAGGGEKPPRKRHSKQTPMKEV